MKNLIVCLVLLMLLGCKEEVINKSAKQTSLSSSAQLLLFFNPSGTPCQIQNRILNEIDAKISSKVSVKHVSTVNFEDRSFFYKYGVRSLPLMIIINDKGEVIKRFSPGIKRKEEILDFIKSCKC